MQKKIILPLLFLQIHATHAMETNSLAQKKETLRKTINKLANKYLEQHHKVPDSIDVTTPEYYKERISDCASALLQLQAAQNELLCETLLPLLSKKRQDQLNNSSSSPSRKLKQILYAENFAKDIINKQFAYPKIRLVSQDDKGKENVTTFQQIDNEVLVLYNPYEKHLNAFCFDNLNNIILGKDGSYKFNMDLSEYESWDEDALKKNLSDHKSNFPIIAYEITGISKTIKRWVKLLDRKTLSFNGYDELKHATNIQTITFFTHNSSISIDGVEIYG